MQRDFLDELRAAGFRPASEIIETCEGTEGALWQRKYRERQLRAAPEEFRACENARLRAYKEKRKVEAPDAYRAAKAATKRRRTVRRNAAGFVAIDSEGCAFGEPFALEDGSIAQPHRTFLWGARREGQTEWLTNGDDAGLSGDCEPLSSEQILDWLCSLPSKFGDAKFVMFAMNYDVMQALLDLPFKKAWEIQKQIPFKERDDPTGLRPSLSRKVFWKDFAICYLKNKYIEIGKLRDPARPSKYDKNGRHIGNDYLPGHLIKIDDSFGFFQCSFVKALEGMNKIDPASGKHMICTPEEFEKIKADKARRGNFESAALRKIKEYTTLELLALSRMMEKLREGINALDLPVKSWHGAGVIAKALMKKYKVVEHYPEQVVRDLAPHQKAALHAFFGGRIELIQQGVYKNKIWNYDISSAYPAETFELPSMKNGKWRLVQNPSREQIEQSSTVSVVHCKFGFHSETLNRFGKFEAVRFFPLPYRQQDGSILFPSSGEGWYMRDEMVETLNYRDAIAGTDQSAGPPSRIELIEMWEFVPSCDERPFHFVPGLFEQRAALVEAWENGAPYSIMEKIIKLGLNSLYGKTAQNVGGDEWNLPKEAQCLLCRCYHGLDARKNAACCAGRSEMRLSCSRRTHYL